MTGVLDRVNSRTQLVGENRLELLLFKLAGDQTYGINVFKVKEVLQCPKLYGIPQRHAFVCGVAHIRGSTVSIIDMNHAIGGEPQEDVSKGFVIIAEYNRTTQGFLVSSVEHIVNLNWENVHPPPPCTGEDNYLTAITQADERLVEIIDVEKILAEITPIPQLSDAEKNKVIEKTYNIKQHVLVIDDSAIARKQVSRVAESLGFTVTALKDGREALNYLYSLLEEGKNPAEEFLLILSDIEMPEMDGYTFTAAVRDHPQLKDLYIILHTSLSGVFNEAMVKKVGADDFVAKFYPDDIAKCLRERSIACRMKVDE